MKEIDLSWAAGFFDGEGCVLISKEKLKNVDYYKIRTYVVNTNEESIKKFMSIVGCGTLTSRKRDGCKKLFIHTAFCNDAIKVINQLLPYSIIKKEQFELGLKFDEQTTICGERKKSIKYHEERKEMYEQMKQLKRV